MQRPQDGRALRGRVRQNFPGRGAQFGIGGQPHPGFTVYPPSIPQSRVSLDRPQTAPSYPQAQNFLPDPVESYPQPSFVSIPVRGDDNATYFAPPSSDVFRFGTTGSTASEVGFVPDDFPHSQYLVGPSTIYQLNFSSNPGDRFADIRPNTYGGAIPGPVNPFSRHDQFKNRSISYDAHGNAFEVDYDRDPRPHTISSHQFPIQFASRIQPSPHFSFVPSPIHGPGPDQYELSTPTFSAPVSSGFGALEPQYDGQPMEVMTYPSVDLSQAMNPMQFPQTSSQTQNLLSQSSMMAPQFADHRGSNPIDPNPAYFGSASGAVLQNQADVYSHLDSRPSTGMTPYMGGQPETSNANVWPLTHSAVGPHDFGSPSQGSLSNTTRPSTALDANQPLLRAPSRQTQAFAPQLASSSGPSVYKIPRLDTSPSTPEYGSVPPPSTSRSAQTFQHADSPGPLHQQQQQQQQTRSRPVTGQRQRSALGENVIDLNMTPPDEPDPEELLRYCDEIQVLAKSLSPEGANLDEEAKITDLARRLVQGVNAFASANGYDELIDAIGGGKGQIQVVLDRKGKGRRMMVDDEAEGGEGDLAELEEQAQAARPAMTIEDETAAQARRDMDYIRERRRELTARAEAEAEKKQAAMRQIPFLGGGIPIGSYPPSSALPLSSMPVPRSLAPFLYGSSGQEGGGGPLSSYSGHSGYRSLNHDIHYAPATPSSSYFISTQPVHMSASQHGEPSPQPYTPAFSTHQAFPSVSSYAGCASCGNYLPHNPANPHSFGYRDSNLCYYCYQRHYAHG